MGPPGCGKSTLIEKIIQRTETHLPENIMKNIKQIYKKELILWRPRIFMRNAG